MDDQVQSVHKTTNQDDFDGEIEEEVDDLVDGLPNLARELGKLDNARGTNLMTNVQNQDDLKIIPSLWWNCIKQNSVDAPQTEILFFILVA